MRAYAVAHLQHVQMGPPIVEYLKRIDETLAAFEGRFLIHGGDKAVLVGDWRGDLIVIEFPNLDRARAWYGSPAYRRILPYRLDNAEGAVILAQGVDDDHKATDILQG